jgi:hypothetical protein
VTTPDVLAAAHTVAEAFERLGVRYYVGGSLASSTRGVPRASIDVDMAAELRPEHVGPLVAALADQYYVTEDWVREAVAARRSFNVIHLATMMKVDVFVSRGRPFDRSAFERLTPESLDAVRPSRHYPVPRAEDVILLKLEWFRAGGEVSDRQWGDVVGVIRVAGAGLDRRYLARWAPELGVSDLLDRALADAEAAG